MWSYYGRKQKIIKSYPIPLYETIIEPFCGTAPYSLYGDNWKHNIVLIDKYDIICKIWWYLQNCSSKDILSLPSVGHDEIVPDYLCDEERWLIGFCVNNGSAVPKKTSGKMNFNSWSRDQINIASNLYKIKHWTVICGEYDCYKSDGLNVWFIDPPYRVGGKYYRHNKIDYDKLSLWCMCRDGQVIVCENDQADWLPFKSLTEMNGQLRKTKEMIWYKMN